MLTCLVRPCICRGWLPYANYTGHKYYHNQYFETWSFSFSGVTLTVGVQAPNYNTPAIYSQSSSGFELFLEFLRFDASTNFNQSFFEVPRKLRVHVCTVMCGVWVRSWGWMVFGALRSRTVRLIVQTLISLWLLQPSAPAR